MDQGRVPPALEFVDEMNGQLPDEDRRCLDVDSLVLHPHPHSPPGALLRHWKFEIAPLDHFQDLLPDLEDRGANC